MNANPHESIGTQTFRSACPQSQPDHGLPGWARMNRPENPRYPPSVVPVFVFSGLSRGQIPIRVHRCSFVVPLLMPVFGGSRCIRCTGGFRPQRRHHRSGHFLSHSCPLHASGVTTVFRAMVLPGTCPSCSLTVLPSTSTILSPPIHPHPINSRCAARSGQSSPRASPKLAIGSIVSTSRRRPSRARIILPSFPHYSTPKVFNRRGWA